MPKNRDYTGLVRTPSSMAWLIFQRSRVKGQMEKLQITLDEGPNLLARYQAELDAIDMLIPIHEVRVDPYSIEGRRPRQTNILPWGNMTRQILNFMREAPRPMFTDEVARHLATVEKIDFDVVPYKRFQRQIGARLRALFAAGIIDRHHSCETRTMGRWSLRDTEGH